MRAAGPSFAASRRARSPSPSAAPSSSSPTRPATRACAGTSTSTAPKWGSMEAEASSAGPRPEEMPMNFIE